MCQTGTIYKKYIYKSFTVDVILMHECYADGDIATVFEKKDAAFLRANVQSVSTNK